jgi:autotransporter-associated beta strand protein
MYRRLLKIVVIMVPAFVATDTLQSADIDLLLTVEQLENGTAQWQLAAAARSAGDNDGIAGFNIDLTGITSGQHQSPIISPNADLSSPTAGFTIGGVDIGDNGSLFAAQNQFVPGSRIYGVGEPGSVPPTVGPGLFDRNIPWDHPVTLATGTAAGLLGPNFGQNANMTVWSQGQAAIGGVAAEFANVFSSIVRIPFGVNEWIHSGSGSWHNPTHWSAELVPNHFTARVGFGDAISSPSTVTVFSGVTVERIEFDSAVPYTIASDGPTNSIALAGNATIHVAQGSHTISAPIAGTNGLTKSGPGALTLSGVNTYSGDTRISGGTLNVQNQPNQQSRTLPGGEIVVSAGATLRLREFVDYALRPNQTLSGAGNVILEHSNSTTKLSVGPTNAIRGSLNIQADEVVNSGRIAPGFSPGIIRIDGDYTQEPNGVLEIEVGGLTPGTEHDQLIVTGTAFIDGGRLDVPLINGFVPALGNEIEFLVVDPQNLSGSFGSVFAPNLASAAPDLALELDSSGRRLRFVGIAPAEGPGSIQFTSQQEISSWIGADNTWTDNSTPGPIHPITVKNLIGSPQTVVVDNPAFTHRLNVEGGAAPVTVVVTDGASLSATAGVTISDQGAIELRENSNLVGASTSIQEGGRLLGNGTVVGNLVVGVDAGARQAFLSPGLTGPDTSGHLDVEGNYQQETKGTLLMNIESTEEGDWDTIDIAGSTMLGGTLRIDALGYTTDDFDGTFEIITAGNLSGRFESIESIGNRDVYFRAIYSDTGAAAEVGQSANVAQGTVTMADERRGDMNADGMIDNTDVDLFVLGLMNPSQIRFGMECNCDVFPQQGGDFSLNGLLDYDDIPFFRGRMGGAGLSAHLLTEAFDRYFGQVPEPSSAAMLLAGGIIMMSGRGRAYRKLTRARTARQRR